MFTLRDGWLTHGLAYVATLVAFAWGIFTSLAANDWSWFARSGSLVVIIGIVLTSSQIFEHNRKLKRRRNAIERRFEPPVPNRSHHDWAGEDGIKSLVRSRTLEEYAWEIESEGLYLLILGTLVWGFGDLLGSLV